MDRARSRKSALADGLGLTETELVDLGLGLSLGQRLQTVKYTVRTCHILEAAARIAEEFGHDYIGTEHIALALTSDDGGVAAAAMSRLGITEQLRAEVTLIVNSVGYATASHGPLGSQPD